MNLTSKISVPRSLQYIESKKVLLRENARGMLTAAYHVHGLSYWWGGGEVLESQPGGGYPSPSQGVPSPGQGMRYPRLWEGGVTPDLTGVPLVRTGVPPERTWDQRLGKNLGPKAGVPPVWTDRRIDTCETLPLLIFRMQSVINLPDFCYAFQKTTSDPHWNAFSSSVNNYLFQLCLATDAYGWIPVRGKIFLKV